MMATPHVMKPQLAHAESRTNAGARKPLYRINVLGVPVAAVTMSEALREIEHSASGNETPYICAADVHSVMQAQRNEAHMKALKAAHMVLADGSPVVWAAQRRGQIPLGRVSGPDLMLRALEYGIERNWRHFFYGGAPGVAEELARKMQNRFPGLQIAGTLCPPFRELTPDEKRASIEAITASSPNILWVGLGCPKQELWMHEYASAFPGTTLIGVGAAFDFHSERISRAPAWMRDHALEWLHRLMSEPQRLWRRYLLLGPEFILKVLLDVSREGSSSMKTRET